ncbi:MAG TPA: flavodoxin family protein [bacterium]|nr:flavodoxin family protein [bacterium]HOL66706.1 flavodoxin family protein [bacterium]
MKLLALYGSPRPRGNSTILLDRFLEGASSQETEINRIYLSQLTISPCQACLPPETGRWCRIDDGMTAVYEEVLAAEALVIASPIYFGSLPAQVKAMIDRFQCVWLARKRGELLLPFDKKKPGFFLCVEASHRQDFFQNARAIVRNFFATTGFLYSGELFCRGLEKQGDVSSRKECLEQAYQAGVTLIHKGGTARG